MATEVILPRVDMDMVEGKVAHWYVKEGESVRKGQVLFEIETDKATMEVDATTDGVIRGIRGEIGVSLPVGEVIGWILAPGEALPTSGADSNSLAADSQANVASPTCLTPGAGNVEGIAWEGPEASAALLEPTTASLSARAPATDAGAAATPSRLRRATPLARGLARQHGIDLGGLEGTGPSGRILARDLLTTIATTQGGRDRAPGAARIHLQWMRRGSGVPLVLIHGFGADHGSWRPLVQQFAEGLPVIGIDLPDHGKSESAEATSMQALAQPVIERLDEEGVVDFHLLGHSLGGGVALALAQMLPGRIRSLSLLAPAGLGPDINAGFIDGLVQADDEPALKATMSELFRNPALLTGSFVATAFQQLQVPRRRSALTALAQRLMPRGRQSQSLRDVLDGLRAPVQVIWGIDDRVIPVQHGFDLPRHVGLHLLPAVGHLPQVEAAPLVAALVTHQLRSTAGWH